MMNLDEHGQPPVDYNWRQRLDRDVNELMGWVRGIICDGAVTTKEAESLDFWVRTHEESARVWPVDVIADRLRRVFSDGRAEADELQELEALLEDFAAGALSPVVAATTGLPLDAPPPDVEFQGRSFCLTGRFLYGTRRYCEQQIVDRGGEPCPNPLQRLNYLVLGIMGSRDWAHSSFGRKIEKVMEYKRAGQTIAVVTEKHWAAYL